MPATGGYKRYCSEACRRAHAARDARTAAVYLRIPAIAAATQTEADLLRMVLELDSRRADGDESASGAIAFAGGHTVLRRALPSHGRSRVLLWKSLQPIPEAERTPPPLALHVSKFWLHFCA